MWNKIRPIQHYKDEKDLIVYIYGLTDPRDGFVFYIGKTRNELRERLNGHVSHAKRGDMAKRSQRIREILSCKTKPDIFLIEITTMEYFQEREKFWISEYKSLGYQLDNSDSGGGGML